MDEFRIKFNNNKQWIEVRVWDVHPTTFARWGGGHWAYFEQKWSYTEGSTPRKGLFGELHLVKSGIREDTVVHEMFHVLCELVWSRRDAITGRNEESYARILDELVRKFYREYNKPSPN